MSLIDTTFTFAPAMIAQWGMPVTFVRSDAIGEYNVLDGRVTPPETQMAVNAVVLSLTSKEARGVFQDTDYKIVIDAAQLMPHYITTRDKFIVPTNGQGVVMDVIDVKTYRGQDPLAFFCICRPQ